MYSEAERAQKRAYYLANRERRLAYQKQWNGTNPEKHRSYNVKWRAEHRAEERERAAKFRHEQPDEAKATHKRSRMKHADRWKRRAKIWRENNCEQTRIQARRRLARKRQAGGSHTAKDIEALLVRQRFRCANPVCKKSIRKKRHIDHIVALATGGSNGIENIQLLCPPCNQRKGTKRPEVWMREHGMLL
jgi:5-methylcytosine-specific restriction endonuclease McrA